MIGCFMENGDHCTSLQNNNQPIQAFFVFGALSALPLLNLQSWTECIFNLKAAGANSFIEVKTMQIGLTNFFSFQKTILVLTIAVDIFQTFLVILIQSAVFVLRGYIPAYHIKVAQTSRQNGKELKREKQKFCNFVSRFSTQPVVRINSWMFSYYSL